MTTRTDPMAIQDEWQKGISYNQRIDLYDTVETHERMYNGDCWYGVNAPDLDKPVIPLLKRAIAQFVAMVVSDDIAYQLRPRVKGTAEHAPKDAETAMRVAQRELEAIDEDEKTKTKRRILLRDAAVRGDCCLYSWFDPDAETGQRVKGAIRKEVVRNTNVIFGNPHDLEVESQPYIILPMRLWVEDVRREAAEKGGMSKGETSRIVADEDALEHNAMLSAGDLCTVLVKLWKNPATGTVWATKVCQGAVIRKPWDLKYRRYPISYMSWDYQDNCYHGTSVIAGLIPNQIFINKLYAMAMKYVRECAFPRIAYDKNRLPKGIPTKIGENIGVDGSPADMIFQPLRQPDMSNQAFVMIDKVLEHTQSLLGINDVLLGNVRPDNTSAIIAVTKNSSVPLEVTRLNFYQMIEDDALVSLDIMAADYGRREVPMDDGHGGTKTQEFDFSTLRDIDMKCDIDVGQSSYWSLTMQMQTLDNMWAQRIITDPIDYLEGLPEGIINFKNQLLAKYRAMKRQADEHAAGAPNAPGMPNMPTQPTSDPSGLLASLSNPTQAPLPQALGGGGGMASGQ